ncbi:Protein NEP-17 a [Aphelenchoides avenae]|nr:Protein NEP-17 a [Aphelenchus avenae]
MCILANAPDAAKKAITKDYKIDLYTPTLLDELKKLFTDGNTYGVTPADLYNYLYYMLLQRYDSLMPAPTNSKKRSLSQAIKKRQRDVREKVNDPVTSILSKNKRRPIVEGGWETYEPLETDADDLQLDCIGETMDKLQYASGRAYVDVALPTEESKKKIRDSANHILTEVLVAFQSMIDQLDWMSSLSKKSAYAKIANIAKNIGYNDFIVDDAKLEDHYKTLDFSASTNYIEMSMTLRRFMMFEQFSQLALTDHTDRAYFAGFSPATVRPVERTLRKRPYPM